jgi:hypothetical protein
MHSGKNRAEFVDWLDTELREHRYGLRFSLPMLKTYAAGDRAPPLHVAIAIAEVTEGLVSIQEWPYLKRRFAGPGLIELTYK